MSNLESITSKNSTKFYKNETNADLVLGYSFGSGVGMNMLVSEFGISTYMSGVKGSGTNIVESNPDPTHKQVLFQLVVFPPGKP